MSHRHQVMLVHKFMQHLTLNKFLPHLQIPLLYSRFQMRRGPFHGLGRHGQGRRSLGKIQGLRFSITFFVSNFFRFKKF